MSMQAFSNWLSRMVDERGRADNVVGWTVGVAIPACIAIGLNAGEWALGAVLVMVGAPALLA